MNTNRHEFVGVKKRFALALHESDSCSCVSIRGSFLGEKSNYAELRDLIAYLKTLR